MLYALNKLQFSQIYSGTDLCGVQNDSGNTPLLLTRSQWGHIFISYRIMVMTHLNFFYTYSHICNISLFLIHSYKGYIFIAQRSYWENIFIAYIRIIIVEKHLYCSRQYSRNGTKHSSNEMNSVFFLVKIFFIFYRFREKIRKESCRIITRCWDFLPNVRYVFALNIQK